MKVIKYVGLSIIVIIFLYLAVISLIVFVSWVFGIEPAHILPGMLPYDVWNIK